MINYNEEEGRENKQQSVIKHIMSSLSKKDIPTTLFVLTTIISMMFLLANNFHLLSDQNNTMEHVNDERKLLMDTMDTLPPPSATQQQWQPLPQVRTEHHLVQDVNRVDSTLPRHITKISLGVPTIPVTLPFDSLHGYELTTFNGRHWQPSQTEAGIQAGIQFIFTEDNEYAIMATPGPTSWQYTYYTKNYGDKKSWHTHSGGRWMPCSTLDMPTTTPPPRPPISTDPRILRLFQP